MRRYFLIMTLALFAFLSASAQMYTGMSGLIHVPSAEMNDEGEARIGAHFLNKEFTPANFSYHTMNHYLSITPFSWIEIGYACTLMKSNKAGEGEPPRMSYNQKDRYFSVKLRPLKEGRWYPAIAIGANDPYGTTFGKGTVYEDNTAMKVKSRYFANFYVAATKHINLKGHSIGFHLAYRHWKRDYNSRWNGVVGGITYQPSFQKNLRVIAEYTGDDVNVGFDWRLWRYLLIQASLQDGKHFTGGLCFCVNLL